MQAIMIKWLAPTNKLGARLVAEARVGRLVVGQKAEMEFEEQALELARRFALEMYAHPLEIGGFGMLTTGYCVATLKGSVA